MASVNKTCHIHFRKSSGDGDFYQGAKKIQFEEANIV